MSLTTFSKFYYGFTITESNNALDFNEGGPELQATLNSGDYSLEEFTAEIARAMNVTGALTYTVSVNRTTRFITIASTSNFSLLSGTGTRIGTGAWSLIGFTATDKTGASTYTGTIGAGSVYLPQAIVSEHVPSEDWLEKIDASVNESASGDVQVVLFGDARYIQLNIRLATDKTISQCQPQIETQVNGIANLRAFMDYAITKAKFDFIPDRSNANNFYTVLLDRTEESRQGTAYRLKQIKNAPGYRETGTLVFKLVEV